LSAALLPGRAKVPELRELERLGTEPEPRAARTLWALNLIMEGSEREVC